MGYAPRYSFPPFLLHGRRTDRLLSSSAPTCPTCAGAPPTSPLFPLPLALAGARAAPAPAVAVAAGSRAHTSYAVFFRIKSPTSPNRCATSRPCKLFAFTYKIQILICTKIVKSKVKGQGGGVKTYVKKDEERERERERRTDVGARTSQSSAPSSASAFTAS